MIKAALQPSASEFAPMRPAPRRADHAPPREAFALPEPARDAPGMERRPEPMRARPADARRPDKPEDAEPQKPAHPEKPAHPDKCMRPEKPSQDDKQAEAASDAADETPGQDGDAAVSADSAFAAQQAAGEAAAALTGEALAAADAAETASDAEPTEAAPPADGAPAPMTAAVPAVAAPAMPTATQAEAGDALAAEIGAAKVDGGAPAAAKLPSPEAKDAGAPALALPGQPDAGGGNAGAGHAAASQHAAAALGKPKADSAAPMQDTQSGKPGEAAGEGRTPDAATAAREAAAKLEQLKPDQPKAEQPLPPLTQALRAPESSLAAADRPHAAQELPRALPPAAIPVEIGLRALQGLKEFQIRLDPAELGRVDVRLEIGEDKSVSARVVVDRVETLHLLQRDAKTLERAFEQAGLKSSDAGIDISLRDPGQQRQGRSDAWDGDGQFADRRPRLSAEAPDPQLIPLRRMMHAGALDLSI